MRDGVAITGSMLHDLVGCERRVHHDLHADPAFRDPTSAFVQMLWAGGREHETDVLGALTGDIVDLRDVDAARRVQSTAEAMAGGAVTILGGRLERDDFVGMPDLLRREHDGWVAGDVKSGGAFEADGRRPRREYAVQVAFYASMLAASGLGSEDRAFVIGRDGSETGYDLAAGWDRAGRSLTEITRTLVDEARAIRDGAATTRGAMAAACKMCHWHTLCERELTAADDCTLVAGVGRSLRDVLLPIAPTVRTLAELDLGDDGAAPAVTVPGIGAQRLRRFRERARLLGTPGARPYAIRPLLLDATRRELHFDIEADPSRDGFVYLHGFLDREPGQLEGTYSHVFAETEADERNAFAEAMRILTADPEAMIYYYSKYERSSFRSLQTRHPGVCTPEDIERLFDPARAVDLLFDVITPDTEWPTRNLSIKTLARHLGFEWGDADASGANSIAWYDEYARTRSPVVRQRILDYNADDVRASAVVLDGLRRLEVGGPVRWPAPEAAQASPHADAAAGAQTSV